MPLKSIEFSVGSTRHGAHLIGIFTMPARIEALTN
jgi:hypothetical protein